MDLLITFGSMNIINIWNINNRKLHCEIRNNNIIWCSDISYDGRILIYGDNEGYHYIYNIDNRRLISKNILYDNTIISIACTPTVDKIIIGYLNGVIIVYNQLNNTLKKINSHKYNIQTINVSDIKKKLLLHLMIVK